MKKFFNFILFLVLFFVSANSFAQATTDGNDYARSNRYDKYAVDICYNANGIYGNETDAAFSLNGFSLGISCEYVYFDGLFGNGKNMFMGSQMVLSISEKILPYWMILNIMSLSLHYAVHTFNMLLHSILTR